MFPLGDRACGRAGQGGGRPPTRQVARRPGEPQRRGRPHPRRAAAMRPPSGVRPVQPAEVTLGRDQPRCANPARGRLAGGRPAGAYLPAVMRIAGCPAAVGAPPARLREPRGRDQEPGRAGRGRAERRARGTRRRRKGAGARGRRRRAPDPQRPRRRRPGPPQPGGKTPNEPRCPPRQRRRRAPPATDARRPSRSLCRRPRRRT